jgi:uncharacterized protein with NRDE domain
VCLVVLAFGVDQEHPLVVAANRDEFHARPAQSANWWPDAPSIVGGRDLQAGGTWLGVHRDGRFATVTNYSGAKEKNAGLRSRGHLVTGFLQSGLSPLEYLQTIRGDAYAGFNLLVADPTTLAYLSNRGGGLQELPAGIYGLSNATLDAPWEKVERSKERLGRLFADGRVNETHLLRLLGDRDKSPVHEVKSDRLPFAIAHAITAPFIVTTDYGTRCSTIVRADSGGQWRFHERRFDASGNNVGESQYSFRAGEDTD